MSSKQNMNRRDFLSSTALIGAAGTLGSGTVFTSCDSKNGSKMQPLLPEAEWNIPDFLPDEAIDGVPLKAGVIGCGGRGLGAALNFINSGPSLSVVALGDVFPDKVEACRKTLTEKFGQMIAPEKCFTGFDNYKKVIDAGVDVVILATPPVFRPLHFKAAIEARKHVFVEKPVAVDPVGARLVIATAKQAMAQNLCVVTGTQRRHQRSYIEGYKMIQKGMIGEIVSGTVYYNQLMLWYKLREKGWSDMEWMLRDWVNWTWLSGDHIVEQHIHNLDVFNWFVGKKPVKATGFGARQRRLTGDQYDMFSVDYTYEGGIHMHSMCRQIDGCDGNISEFIQGTKGSWQSGDVHRIVDLKGNVLWEYNEDKYKYREEKRGSVNNPYVLEHVNWINHIRNKQPICQAEDTAVSTLTAIMGRLSAYSGKDVTWEEVMGSQMNLLPDNPELGKMDMAAYKVPVPGNAK